MVQDDIVERLAKQLAAQILRDPHWDRHLDQLCQMMHADARMGKPRRTLTRAALRAEAILRHIAEAEPATIGRLYFDLMPSQPGHPLTNAVAEALATPETALRMLRDAGLNPQVLKDGNGENYIQIDTPDRTHALCEAARAAIVAAMTGGRRPPVGRLVAIH